MPLSKSHLVLRSSTYHCRLDIPAELRAAYGNRRILSRSLRTGDKRLATELASVQIGQWKAEFRAIRDAKLKAGDRWKEELAAKSKEREHHTTEMLSHRMRGTIPEGMPSLDGLSKEEVKERFVQEAVKMASLAKRVEEAGVSGFSADTHKLLETILNSRAGFEAFKVQSAVLAKLDVSQTANRYNLNKGEIEEAQAIARDPRTYKPKSPISSTAIDSFAKAYAEQNANQRTRDVYLSKIKAFSKYLTTEGKELNFDAVADFLDSTSSKAQTRKGYLAALSKYHKWAVRYDPYYRSLLAEKTNPFVGHDHARVGENAGESWVAFETPEVERLHTASLAKGDNDLADLIQFAAYTGCRIEELGRIRKNTTIFDGSGSPIGFRVDDSKTKAGIREIPIHPALHDIYLRRLADPQGEDGFLFKGNDKQKHGLRLSGLSQRFSKLKNAEGFDGLHVFHSIRKTMITQLQRASVPPLTIANVVGHETGLVTFDTYSAGASWEQKFDAVEKLRFRFN